MPLLPTMQNCSMWITLFKQTLHYFPFYGIIKTEKYFFTNKSFTMKNSSSPETAVRRFQEIRWEAIKENNTKLLARCKTKIHKFKREIQRRKRPFDEEYMTYLLDLQL